MNKAGLMASLFLIAALSIASTFYLLQPLSSLEKRHGLSASNDIQWLALRERARLAERNGQLDKALLLHEQAIELAAKKHSKLDRAESLRDVAEINYKTGNLIAAEEQFEESLAIQEKEENRQLLDPLFDKLAEIYTSQHQYDKAEPYLKELLEIRKQVLPLDGKELMPVYTRYISCLEYQGKREKSLEVCRTVLAEGKTWKTNRTLIKRLTELGMFLSNSRQYVPVIALLRPVYWTASQEISNDRSRAVYVLLETLVRALSNDGKSMEARQLLKHDIKARKVQQGENDPWLAEDLKLLAEIETALKH